MPEAWKEPGNFSIDLGPYVWRVHQSRRPNKGVLRGLSTPSIPRRRGICTGSGDFQYIRLLELLWTMVVRNLPLDRHLRNPPRLPGAFIDHAARDVRDIIRRTVVPVL
jgi:hypothetical protein